MKNKRTAYPHVFWMVLFVAIPIILVFIYSISKSNVLKDFSFTLEHYKKFFNPVYLRILWDSIFLALISSIVCLVLGYPLASILARRVRNTGKGGILFLFILPMWMNMLLRTYSWLTLLEKNGLINTALESIGLGQINILYTDFAIVLGMVYNFLPFMILPIYSVLVKMDTSLIEAAEDLGANKFNVFRRVTLPLSVPGIISGITMVFLPAVTSFIVPKLLGGSKYMLVGTLIENQFLTAYDWNFGSAISIVMMIIILICTELMNLFNKGDDTPTIM